MDKKKRISICLIWAYCALIGMVQFLKIGNINRNFSNNIIFVPFFIMMYFVLHKMLESVKKKEIVYSAFFSFVFSGILVVGAQIEYLRAIAWTMGTALKIILLTLFWIPIIALLLKWCIENKEFSINEKIKWSKNKVFIAIAGMWTLAYLALYPGIYDYDSIAQTLQFLVTNEISSHHPVIHSFILSFFLNVGDTLVGSYQFGLGIYSLLQMLFLAFVAMQVTWFLRERNKKILFYLSLIFFMFFPLHYVMAVWATKDIIFTGLFVLLCLELFKFLENKNDYWREKKNILKYILLVVLMCMFRNNGVYALILMLPICALCLRKQSVKLILITVGAICIYLSYQNVMLPALDVTPGNMREMLSIPCQQLAKVYVERPEIFSEEEKELLFSLIPEKNLKDYQYRPMISDATKNFFDSEQFMSDPQKYIKLYIEIGLRSPRKYIEAFLANSLGFWYPNKSYPDERMFHPYTEFDMADPNLFKGDYIYIDRASKIPLYEKVLKKLIWETQWTKLSGISNLFVPGMYFIIICFIIWISVYRKKWDWMVILGFWMGFWITLLISPVALVRYAYPIIFCLPLCGYMVVNVSSSFSNEKIRIKGEE